MISNNGTRNTYRFIYFNLLGHTRTTGFDQPLRCRVFSHFISSLSNFPHHRILFVCRSRHLTIQGPHSLTIIISQLNMNIFLRKNFFFLRSNVIQTFLFGIFVFCFLFSPTQSQHSAFFFALPLYCHTNNIYFESVVPLRILISKFFIFLNTSMSSGNRINHIKPSGKKREDVCRERYTRLTLIFALVSLCLSPDTEYFFQHISIPLHLHFFILSILLLVSLGV